MDILDPLTELARHRQMIDRLTTICAQLADRITYLEDQLAIVHPPAPWITDGL